jgi:3-hydroxyisobutyrate dehydrogenase-like beta-hydroxyacid dehydrogenase
MNIGFIGLGAMGQGIVPRLIAAGHAVVGWNRNPARGRPLVDAGMRLADSPRAAAAGAEIVLSVVTDGEAVREVALGEDGVIAGLEPGGIYADMSTIAPDVSRAVAAEFSARGRVMLDAPISGSPITLAQGSASLMVGGEEAAFRRAEPVLRAIGPKVTYIGASGLAVQMKIAVNLLLMVEVIAFGEAVALAEKGGVAREVALDAVLKSVAASPVLGYRGPFILEGKMPAVPLADVTLQQKDMLLALDLGRKLGSPLPLGAAANEMMNACRGLGLDHRDFVTAHDVYRILGGQQRRASSAGGHAAGEPPPRR